MKACYIGKKSGALALVVIKYQQIIFLPPVGPDLQASYSVCMFEVLFFLSQFLYVGYLFAKLLWYFGQKYTNHV